MSSGRAGDVSDAEKGIRGRRRLSHRPHLVLCRPLASKWHPEPHSRSAITELNERGRGEAGDEG